MSPVKNRRPAKRKIAPPAMVQALLFAGFATEKRNWNAPSVMARANSRSPAMNVAEQECWYAMSAVRTFVIGVTLPDR